jgi:hypothetical protein
MDKNEREEAIARFLQTYQGIEICTRLMAGLITQGWAREFLLDGMNLMVERS